VVPFSFVCRFTPLGLVRSCFTYLPLRLPVPVAFPPRTLPTHCHSQRGEAGATAACEASSVLTVRARRTTCTVVNLQRRQCNVLRCAALRCHAACPSFRRSINQPSHTHTAVAITPLSFLSQHHYMHASPQVFPPRLKSTPLPSSSTLQHSHAAPKPTLLNPSILYASR